MSDLISKKALIKVIEAIKARYGNDNSSLIEQGEVLDLIEEAPTVNAEQVVHGRWITWAEAGNDVPSEELYECSACHDAAPHLVNGFDFLSAYCPNCGAKMDRWM